MATYEDVRLSIGNGDLIFFRNSDSISAKLIKFFTKSDYNHCAIAFWMQTEGVFDKQLFIIEQYPFGRRITKLSSYKNKHFDIVGAPIKWDLYANELLDGTGKISYSYLDLATIYLKESFDIKITDFKGEVCSEMIGKVLKSFKIIPDGLVSPGELLKALIIAKFPIKLSVN